MAALAALSNLPYIEHVRDALVSERGRLYEGLQAVPFLQASARRGGLLGGLKQGKGCGMKEYEPAQVPAIGPASDRAALILIPPPHPAAPRPALPPQPFPSHSNFVLCKVTDGRDAKGLKDALAQEHGIMVRHYRCAPVPTAPCTRWLGLQMPGAHLGRPALPGAVCWCACPLAQPTCSRTPPPPRLPPPQHHGAEQLHPRLRGPAGAHRQAAGGAAGAGVRRLQAGAG